MAEKESVIRLPHIACEVTAQGVAAVRAEEKSGMIGPMHCHGSGGWGCDAFAGAQNVQDAQALTEAIELALTPRGWARPGRNCGAAGFRRAPDPAGFESLPERRQEADAAVRFRLRKSLPFDIEKAALSFDAQRLRRACMSPRL